MYPPHHQGGYELTWQSCDRHLTTGGHEVRTLTTDHLEPGVLSPNEGDVYRELRWYWRDHAWPRLGLRARLGLERHNQRVLDRHLSEFNPDAIAWWSMGGMSLSLLEHARRRAVPAVAVVCDAWLTYAPREDQWMRLFERRTWLRPMIESIVGVPTRVDIAAAAQFVFLSDVLRREAQRLDRRFTSGEIAHRGPDRDVFVAAPAPPWRWRLLYAGRVDPRKGIDVAIEALAALPAEATLTVARSGGDAAYLEELRAQSSELGLASRVSFPKLGRAELQAAYADADAVVFPVRWEEPWGLVPLEAMVVGTPVVATGIGGSGEYLEHRGNSLTYDVAGGAQALADRVRELAADEGLREQLRQGGFATARGLSAERFNEQVERALVAAARGRLRLPDGAGSSG